MKSFKEFVKEGWLEDLFPPSDEPPIYPWPGWDPDEIPQDEWEEYWRKYDEWQDKPFQEPNDDDDDDDDDEDDGDPFAPSRMPPEAPDFTPSIPLEDLFPEDGIPTNGGAGAG